MERLLAVVPYNKNIPQYPNVTKYIVFSNPVNTTVRLADNLSRTYNTGAAYVIGMPFFGRSITYIVHNPFYIAFFTLRLLLGGKITIFINSTIKTGMLFLGIIYDNGDRDIVKIDLSIDKTSINTDNNISNIYIDYAIIDKHFFKLRYDPQNKELVLSPWDNLPLFLSIEFLLILLSVYLRLRRVGKRKKSL